MSADNKTIVILTGANSGIGYETVRALVQSSRQYHVLFGARSPEKGNEAMTAIKEEFPDSSTSMEMLRIDVSEDEEIDAAYETVAKEFGRVDVLINNAGKLCHTQTVESCQHA